MTSPANVPIALGPGAWPTYPAISRGRKPVRFVGLLPAFAPDFELSSAIVLSRRQY